MDDEHIVAGILKKDERALDQLIDKYGGLIKSIVSFHLYMDYGYQEECMNDILMILWDKIDQYNPEKNSLKNWIGAVCKYRCINYKRKYYREQFDELDDSLQLDNNPERIILEEELSDETESLLTALSKKDREIFRKRFLKDESIDDISKSMKLAPSVIYNRISKGKKKIKKFWGGRYEERI